MTKTAWTITNKIPARFALGNVGGANELVVAVETPENFSSDKLGELINILGGLSPITIAEAQKRFIDETVPRRFTKFNINLSSLLIFLEEEHGKQPNNWPVRPDINKFIRVQYKGTFAPQVTEKIKKTSAEELKNRLLQLAQDNPDLGLLFWE